jgi:hypothetical protein
MCFGRLPCPVYGVLSLMFWMPCAAAQQLPITLKEDAKPGRQFQVRTRGELSGSLLLPATTKTDASKAAPAKALKLTGSAATEYDETWLAVNGAAVVKSFRIYRALDYRRAIGDQRQESALRADVRRLIIIPQSQNELIFSPDAPLTQQEVEQVQLEVFTPRLAGLLPAGPVNVGDAWKAGEMALAELLDMEIDRADVACRLLAIEARDGRPFAVVSFGGLASGTSQDGPCRQRVDGTYSFDLDGRFLSDLSLSGISWMLDGAGKEVGKIEGRFVVTRRAIDRPDLRASELERQTMEPTEQNTALLLDEPVLGVRLVYPRRWTVTQADKRQVILDDGAGAGLVLTMEALKQLPTAAQFQAEARAALEKQKVTVLRGEPPRRLVGGAGLIDQFRFEVANDKQQRFVLEYYVVTQTAGGATVAANFAASRAAEAAAEVERIVKSLRLSTPAASRGR